MCETMFLCCFQVFYGESVSVRTQKKDLRGVQKRGTSANHLQLFE